MLARSRDNRHGGSGTDTQAAISTTGPRLRETAPAAARARHLHDAVGGIPADGTAAPRREHQPEPAGPILVQKEYS